MEARYCPYCGAEGTLVVGNLAWIETYEDDEHADTLEDPVETFGGIEVECTACDTRHFQI